MAIILSKRALEIDDQYAPAWVYLSAAYANTPPTEAMPLSSATVMARTAIQRALAIEPDNVIAISLNAMYSVWFDQDLATGVAEMRRALELAPDSLDTIKPAAFFLIMLGRHEESVHVQEYISVRDPLTIITWVNVVAAYYYAGQFEKVVSVVDENLAWFRDNDLIQSFYAVSILYSGDAERALGVADRQDVAIYRLGVSAQVYYALGRQAEFETVLAELRDLFETQPEAATDIAWVYAYIGDVEQAFEWLDRALAKGTISLYAADVSFANLHDDPRWDVLMDKLGMSQATLDAIEFEVALPK
jgi:tetratricopeptide (TPR) repeat protein